jgi:outer membrane protein OmpA-like peptidoglycan-associated protein
MSDVLFDVGRYTLRPGAREKLAKVAGIILGSILDSESKWKVTPIARVATK